MAQTELGQSRQQRWCPQFWALKGGSPNLEKVGFRRGGPEGWAPKGRAPKGGAPKGGRPKISRFFFLLLHPFSFFFSLRVSSRVFFPRSGGLLVEFWWCFGRSGLQMYLFSPSGCLVEAPGGLQAAGVPVDFWPRPLLARFRSTKIAPKNDQSWPGPSLTTFGPRTR